MNYILGILLLSLQSGDRLQPAAMILKLEGKDGTVSVQTAKGGNKAAHVMDLLFPGDRLLVKPGSRVLLVFLRNGRRERVAGGAPVTVGKDGCQPAAGVERFKTSRPPRAVQDGLDELRRGGRTLITEWRGDENEKTPRVSPMRGETVVTDRPDFTWPPVEKAKGYRVKLVASGSNRLIWKQRTTKHRLMFPKNSPPLKRGPKYEWRVEAEIAEDAVKTAVNSHFLVITKGEVSDMAQLKRLAESKDSADALLAATAYHAYGVYGEALALFERLAKQAPKEPAFQAACATYYERAGRIKDADKARARAKELGYVFPAKKEDPS